MSDKDIEQFKELTSGTCVICSEELNKNHCLLLCEHAFCVSCIAQHCRINNNCPLCRKEICNKPKIMDKIPREFLVELFNLEYANVCTYTILNDVSSTFSFQQSVQSEIDNFEQFVDKFIKSPKEFNTTIYKEYKEEMILKIFENIHTLNVNICKRVMHYYEEQI